jgi:small subunit ribosomal protein S17
MTGTNVASAPPVGEKHGQKRTLVGRVTSAKMKKTVVVEVTRSVRHPVYGKYVRRRAKYKAHDEVGQYREGDMVEIQEHRPISRDKRWAVTRLVSRPEET